MKKKYRLDKYLFENGYSKSREKAKREIIAGWVKVNGETIRVPSENISGQEQINVSRPKGDYVSRGGYKLEKALKVFDINVNNKTVIDLGASTGGFTHCLLLNGAKKVYAVDVGYGQLDYSLRIDNRVVVLEKTNARNIELNMFDESIELITSDMSFISIQKYYNHIKSIFPSIDMMILIKPQFEAEPGEHKKGVVKTQENHYNIVMRTLNYLDGEGFTFYNIDFSPIKGPKGNVEFLLHMNTKNFNCNDFSLVKNVIERAHSEI